MASHNPGANQAAPLTLSHLLDRPSWDLPGWNVTEVLLTKRLQFDDLDKSLALLRRYRNALCPIHRLSPDILALVFQELVSADSNAVLSPQFGSCPWMYVTHVCYSWRVVALACASLWTQLSSHFDQTAVACLERSVDAPLTVIIDPKATMENAFMAALRPHFGRIRQLYLPCTFLNPKVGHTFQTMSPLLQSAAPVLETLYAYKVPESSTCFKLPPIFSRETPRLTTLKLCHGYPNVDSISFTNLRELFLKGKKKYRLEMEVSTLFNILEACPQLQVFKSAKLRFTPSSSSEELPMVHLDNLRLLDIARSPGSVVADIVGHILAPRCATILNVWLEGGFQFGIPDYLDAAHHLHHIKYLRVEFRGDSDFMELVGTTTAGNNFQISAGVERDGAIGEMMSIAGPFFRSMMRTLDLESLEELTIADIHERSSAPVFPRETWLEVFRRTSLLQALHIWVHRNNAKGYSRTILPALTGPDEITHKLLCPRLHTLSMVHDRTWSSLQCFILAQERARSGHPLKKVSLAHKCYENMESIMDTDIPELRKVVESVDLDPPEARVLHFPDAPW
ncbi:hypothetical protein B0H21DRAFT_775645 [Amylocystis lapponica]|nr:hypothetical protein B0H21DRAFT_775645 [Amylocystis lapponica]